MSAITPVSSGGSHYEDLLQNVTMGGHTPKFANLPQADQAREAARQFEAILVRQLLDESIGKSLMGNSGAQSNVYGYMMTDMFAERLTQGSGLGLGEMLTRQLMPAGAELKPEATTPQQP